MKIIYGQQLVKRVRELADNVQKRLWVASPYLSSWAQIRKIIGRNWIDRNEQIKTRFGVRLLTDIAGGKFINPETLERFRKYGEVRTKSGLHAKIYIIDDSAIITSANLTGTAFSKRYEVGILLDSKRETQQIVDLFEDWWQKKVKEIPEDWEPESDRRETRREREEPFEAELEQLWSLPPDPGDPDDEIRAELSDYDNFLKCYREFAEIYEGIQRLWKKTPLFFETDAFLNYLYHEAPTPSKKYAKLRPRNLNSEAKRKEIKKYALMFNKWVLNPSEDSELDERPEHRLRKSSKIKRLLGKKKIKHLNKDDIKEVVYSLESTTRYGNLTRFLENNNIKTIREAWENLLYGSAPLEIRMSQCRQRLRFFGKSSIGELLGYFKPEKYALRTVTSNAGLRFFGYKVKAY